MDVLAPEVCTVWADFYVCVHHNHFIIPVFYFLVPYFLAIFNHESHLMFCTKKCLFYVSNGNLLEKP